MSTELVGGDGAFAMGFQLDENAFARAGDRSIDDALLGPVIHVRQAAGATRIVQRPAVLRDVRNAILQLHEHVRAMVDAQAITGA